MPTWLQQCFASGFASVTCPHGWLGTTAQVFGLIKRAQRWLNFNDPAHFFVESSRKLPEFKAPVFNYGKTH